MDAPPPPGPHGGDGAAVAAWLGVDPEEVFDLSASLNPEAPDLAPIVAAAASCLRHYPDASAATELLAGAMEVDPDRLVLTNGGAEAIALVAQVEPEGWVETPEFSLYERHLASVRPGAPRWRSNPSNPTGELADTGETAAVWDEAFFPLATGRWTRGDEEAWRLGSLTKLWACPGLRIGYAIAPSGDLASRLRDRQPRWSVNAIAIAAVESLLGRTDLAAWSASIAARRSALVLDLREAGFTVTDSDACWVLVDHPGLREALLPQGVLVRDCASFGMAGMHRIAVPDDAGHERLLAALQAVEP